MMTNIHPTAHIGMVALKVENLPLMSEFYQEIIGLDVKKNRNRNTTWQSRG